MKIQIEHEQEKYSITGMDQFDLNIETDIEAYQNDYNHNHQYWQYSACRSPMKRVRLYARGALTGPYKAIHIFAYSLMENKSLSCTVSMQDIKCVEGKFVCSKLNYALDNNDNLTFSVNLVSQGEIKILYNRS